MRDRGACERFMRQASVRGGIGIGGGSAFHHPPRRSSVQDAAALRNRRRSTLRRQVARELIAEEEENLSGDPKHTPAASVGFDRRQKTIPEQVIASISNPPDVSRLRTRRQSTPAVLPLRFDPEFSTSSSSQPIGPPLPRQSIVNEEGGSSAPAVASRYHRYSPPSRRGYAIISVCLSVIRISAKLISRFHCNLLLRLGLPIKRTD